MTCLDQFPANLTRLANLTKLLIFKVTMFSAKNERPRFFAGVSLIGARKGLTMCNNFS